MKALRAAAAAVFVVMIVGAPASAAEEVKIDTLNLSAWPTVKVAVSGGESTDFAILENGIRASKVSVRSFEETGTRVEVILAIDTSGSMQGEPHLASLDAARRFIDSVPENVMVGLVTFDNEARVIVPPTADRDRALKALDGLVADGETALYDAVKTSVGAFGDSDQRNIVLLSDGADTVSVASFRDALNKARESDVAVYAVGLKSGEFDEQALKSLSTKTGGAYSAADVAELSGMFTGLAETIENQYEITYRSSVESGSQFTLNVSSRDGSDERLLLAPEVDVPEERRFEPSPSSEPILTGTTGLVVVLVACFAAVALLSYTVMSSSARQRRDAKLARLMASASPESSDADTEDDRGPAGWLPDPLVNAAEGMATRRGWKVSLDRKLERAGSTLKAGELMAASVVFGAGGAIVGVLLGSFLLFLVLAIAGALLPNSYITMRGNRRFSALEGQLPDILMVLASSLRAGHSFLQALDAVANELPDPGGPEFARVVAEIRLGRPLGEAMDDLGERIGSEDFTWAMLAVNIQREVGGNLAEILDTVAGTIRSRAYVRRQTKVLAAEGKLSMVVLGVLPLGIAGWMTLVNPSYIGLLVTTPIGLVMTTVACTLLALGFLWMRKVVKIDV